MGNRQICFAVDHPTAAGHFPGNPIIPGAVLLDELIAALEIEPPFRLRATKFLHPVRPGEMITLTWHNSGDETRFEGRLGEDGPVIMTGLIGMP